MRKSSFERLLLEFLQKHLFAIAYIFVIVLALLARYDARNFVSGDAEGFLLPWYDRIQQAGGLPALAKQVGNYNVSYQLLIALLTYLPIKPIYAYKLLSVIFDFSLAFACATLVRSWSIKQKELRAFVVFAAVLFSPLVTINSSIWAQCDSIYVSFLIWSFVALLEKKYTRGFLLFGVALAFKLQAVFFLPVLILFYLREEGISLLHFALTPLASLLFSLPALAYGRDVFSLLRIYSDQVTLYPKMTLNYPNLYSLLQLEYGDFHYYAIGLACLGIGVFLLMLFRYPVSFAAKDWVQAAAWISWTCVLFLPAMYDRYGYLAEILLLILFALDFQYIWAAGILHALLVPNYVDFLRGFGTIPAYYLAISNLILYGVFTMHWLKLYRQKLAAEAVAGAIADAEA